MSNARSGAARLRKVGELMRAATPPSSLQRHLEGRARLISSVQQLRKRSPARPALVALSFAAAAAVLVFVGMRMRTGPVAGPPIAWHVEDGTVGAQGYVSIAPTAPPARLVFDDGSDVALAPGARGRVAATTAVGAEVVLEQGRARVHVQHHDKSRWMVDAGPFAVHVTGTEFFVAWAADAEMLDVWMKSGRVEVSGPVLGESLALSAGQHLRARLRDKTVQIDSDPEPAGALTAINPAPPPADSTAMMLGMPSVEVGGPSPATVAAGPSWPKLVTAGDYGRVVKEANAEGVGHALASRPMGDLRALGDAARYSGNPALARRAYLGIRSRFPATGEARGAAFLLGRVAEEQEHATADAARWYDTYLAEAPGGAFAGDALGRKMVLVSKTQGRDAAKPLADRYLQRFPAGPYAAAAHDLAP